MSIKKLIRWLKSFKEPKSCWNCGHLSVGRLGQRRTMFCSYGFGGEPFKLDGTDMEPCEKWKRKPIRM